jgi:mRNA interferase RelE/StbE
VYSIKYHKRVAKFINSRTPKDKKHIKQKMDKIKQNPYPTNASADIKKLKNRVGFRLRVGNYRFIYELNFRTSPSHNPHPPKPQTPTNRSNNPPLLTHISHSTNKATIFWTIQLNLT